MGLMGLMELMGADRLWNDLSKDGLNPVTVFRVWVAV